MKRSFLGVIPYGFCFFAGGYFGLYGQRVETALTEGSGGVLKNIVMLLVVPVFLWASWKTHKILYKRKD